MFLWFFGTAILSVWFVFRDDRFDYRLLIVGSILPDAIDIFSGGAWVMHSVLASIAALAIVMIATAGRKPSRRRLLALPIGMFMHLIFDGAFASARLFWWPLAGFSFDDAKLPSATRMGPNVLFEIIESFDPTAWNPETIRAHAQMCATSVFETRMRQIVEEEYQKHRE